MDKISTYLQSLDLTSFWKIALILLAGILLLSIVIRFIFGKRSELSHAISSAIGILFIYVVTILLRSAGADPSRFIAPLPFVHFSGDSLVLFSFTGSHYTLICNEILSMIILAFLVNLAESWLPKGKNIFTWLFFRCLNVFIAYVLHLLVTGLFTKYLPGVIVTYAPVILLGILLLLLLTGALKVLLGVVLTVVNPIIGALYTFFFASVVGKMVSKAVLTTAILIGLIFALQYAGITAISVAASAMVGYIPFLLVLIALWYIVITLL